MQAAEPGNAATSPDEQQLPAEHQVTTAGQVGGAHVARHQRPAELHGTTLLMAAAPRVCRSLQRPWPHMPDPDDVLVTTPRSRRDPAETYARNVRAAHRGRLRR